MPIGQDEDIRIYELPEAQELTAGMKVAVDSETDGTKSFDLSNLAGKVDEPETAPEAGQVLTFDGTVNVWADAPEGVPTTTAQDEGKVLTVDSNGGAVWGQSGFVVTLTEDFTTSPSTLSIDKTFTEINTAIQSSQSIKFNYDKKSPIGTVRVFSGSDVQTVYGSYIAFNCLGSNGKVTSVQLKVDDTVSIVESNNLPTSTSSDEGKVLTVDSNGTPVWGQSGSSVMAVKYTSVPGSGSVLDKTFAEIKAALDNRIPVIMIGPNPNVTFEGQSTICTEYFVQTYTVDKIVFRSTLLVCPYSEPANSAVSEIVLSSNDTIEYSKYVPINFSLANVYNAETITTSTYTIPKNNSWGELTVDSSVSSLTLNISNVDTLYPFPVNFAVEITPAAQLTLAVTVTYSYDGEPDYVKTLKHSVSAGNVLEAGKTYQVTAVGNCWTLAEFEA